jgi:hypothetical protein
MQDKIVKDIQNKFLRACERNLLVGTQINKVVNKLDKAKVEENNLFVEVHSIELESLINEYNRNCKTVGESIIQLGIIKPNFIYN